MAEKPTYEELKQRVRKLEKETNRRKRSEKKLMDSEERFRYLTESSPLGVFQTDKDGSVLYLNNRWLTITGMSLQDALGFGWAQALHPEDQPRIIEEWARCLEEKRGYDGEFRFVRPSKEIRWVHTRTSPVFSPAGDIISHVGVNEDITDRKQAEEALRKSELKYKTLVHNIPGMVYRGYADWSAEIISGSEEICGYTNIELNSEKEGWLSIIHSDDKARVFAKGSELAKRKQSTVQTYRIVTKGGDNCWVEDRKTSLFTEEGEFIGIDGIVFDITKRKQAEEALRDSEERLAAFMDSATDGFILFDSELNYIKMNKAAHEITGVNRKEITGKNVLDIIPDFKETGRYYKYKKVMKTGVPLITPDLIPHPKFGNKRLNLKVFKVSDGVGVIFTDITESKRTEEALRESEKRYRAVIESQAEMICRFLPDGTLTFVNEAYCRYFDKGREELIGQKFMPLIPESDQDKIFENIASLNPNTPVITHEHRVIAPNGEICWQKWTNRAIFDDKSNLLEYQAVGWDITNRVRVEESLQKAHDELERRVEERTRELELQKNRLRFLSSRLIKAQEHERRRVSKGLHDEMGQALAILKLKLRSIQREFPEGQSSLKEEFDDTAQYIDHIIEIVRRLSKDLSPAILEDLGLSSALEWLIENFGKQHSIRTSVEMVNIDHLFSQETQTNLYRIFQEALTNIVKHARADHVSFVVKKEEKGSVFFLIKDNGKGFDVNGAVEVNIAERGMGLTAMNERAQIMGAILDIQSRPGEGTRITLEISA